jgi:molybdenum cofactor cytidylyltransferase
MSPPRTFAVVPAAGKSTRMGRPKLSLPLGDRTVIEHVIGALRDGGVEHILVVVGRHVPELVPLAERAGAHVLLLPEETADMRATVEHGLRWLEEHFQPRPEDAWLLVPADHPTLDAAVVEKLLEARRSNPAKSITIPTFGGRRGHPALIGWRHVEAIQQLPAGEGLNVYLRRHAAQALEVAVENAHVGSDLDTPDDYEQLRRSWRKPAG